MCDNEPTSCNYVLHSAALFVWSHALCCLCLRSYSMAHVVEVTSKIQSEVGHSMEKDICSMWGHLVCSLRLYPSCEQVCDASALGETVDNDNILCSTVMPLTVRGQLKTLSLQRGDQLCPY